jgi:MRG
MYFLNVNNRESAIQEVMAGIKEYFNVTLGSLLLYKFERPQYSEVVINFCAWLVSIFTKTNVFSLTDP